MTKKTILNDAHRELGAKMVDFGGWDMPLHYGSQLEEHHQVRQDAGMFDVSHMTVVDLRGARVREFLRLLLANNVDKLKAPGKALYTCMLNERGGVIDDLIVYFVEPDFFRLVVNASTREKDMAWISMQAKPFAVTAEERQDLALIAVQGPNARRKVHYLVPLQYHDALNKLPRFAAVQAGDWFIARTGYTGEDGYECMVPAAKAEQAWLELIKHGVKPCGLGARDTLRLEAGMNLYGQDMDEATTPFEAGLGWTVALAPPDRAFIGREALERQSRDGVSRHMVGLLMEDKGVLRHGQKVLTARGEGEILSGTFSPTLAKSVALARIPVGTTEGLQVDIRGRHVPVQVVKFPFVREGKIMV